LQTWFKFVHVLHASTESDFDMAGLSNVCFWPMLLKKSFCGYEQIFSEALVRRSENDVGGHMISPISSRQPS
jgi:hypothetical protein